MKDVVFVSPDEGRVKMTLHYQKRLGGELAIVDKRRSSATKTEQAGIIGASLQGKIALMFDDMISTAGSIVGAADIAKQNGATEVRVFATHGVLCGQAIKRIQEGPIEQIVVTDTIPLSAEKQIDKIKVLSVDVLIAKAIRHIHENESISRLFDEY